MVTRISTSIVHSGWLWMVNAQLAALRFCEWETRCFYEPQIVKLDIVRLFFLSPFISKHGTSPIYINWFGFLHFVLYRNLYHYFLCMAFKAGIFGKPELSTVRDSYIHSSLPPNANPPTKCKTLQSTPRSAFFIRVDLGTTVGVTPVTPNDRSRKNTFLWLSSLSF